MANTEETSTSEAAIFATAASVVGALPIPLVDTALAGLARGAAMRRVARRHGVRLERDARRILARAAEDALPGGQLIGAARSIAVRLIAPLRIVQRLEVGLRAFAAMLIFDHYLRTTSRASSGPLGPAEAERVKRAIDTAMVGGVLSSAREAPNGLLEAIRDAWESLREADPDEGRAALERVVDTLLDAAADAPSALLGHLTAKFDAAYAFEADRPHTIDAETSASAPKMRAPESEDEAPARAADTRAAESGSKR